MTFIGYTLRHPIFMRRWLQNKRSWLRIAGSDIKFYRYRRKHGYGYWDVPPDEWPQPIPEGWGSVYRCLQKDCDGLFYVGIDVPDVFGTCPDCGCGSGVGVGHYGKRNL